MKDQSAPHDVATNKPIGTVVSVFGKPLDGEAAIDVHDYRNILVKPAPLAQTKLSHEVLETGIKTIDLLCAMDFTAKITTKDKIKVLDGPSAFEEIHLVISNFIKALEEITEEIEVILLSAKAIIEEMESGV